MDILLDYAFTVNPIAPLPPVNAAYIKAVLAVVKPKSGVDEKIVLCTSKTAVLALTENEDVASLFDGGMVAVYVLPVADIDDAKDLIEAGMEDFFTVLISSDFTETEAAEYRHAAFKGVIGYTFNTDDAKAKAFAVTENHCAFIGLAGNGAKNMFYSFGKLLSSTSWRNQQYITTPYSDEINELGTAKHYYNQRYSFILTSKQYGNRLAFFVAGQQAITAPYIIENLKLDAQSAAVSYIALNNPDYTVSEASLLSNAIQIALDRKYIQTGLVTSASVTISLVNDNFRATGQIAVPIPKALWGVDVDLIQGE